MQVLKDVGGTAGSFTLLLRRQYRPQLIITVLMPFFQQFSGINAVIFYSASCSVIKRPKSCASAIDRYHQLLPLL